MIMLYINGKLTKPRTTFNEKYRIEEIRYCMAS